MALKMSEICLGHKGILNGITFENCPNVKCYMPNATYYHEYFVWHLAFGLSHFFYIGKIVFSGMMPYWSAPSVVGLLGDCIWAVDSCL